MELLGSRIRLRDLADEDFETTHVYGSDPEVVRHMAWGPNSPQDTRGFIQRARESAAATPRSDFELAIVESRPGGGGHVGGCGLMKRRLQYREYEIGYCLARHAWGRGLATEAVRLMLDFAFGELAAHRLYACVDLHNRASQAVVEKAGFRLEGTQLRDTLIRGEWRDSLIYARLCDEVE